MGLAQFIQLTSKLVPQRPCYEARLEAGPVRDATLLKRLRLIEGGWMEHSTFSRAANKPNAMGLGWGKFIYGHFRTARFKLHNVAYFEIHLVTFSA